MSAPPVSRKDEAPAGEERPAARCLGRIRFVLVAPTGPLNVGAAARAMANFGLSDLRVVNGPPLDHPQAKEMATHGGLVLGRARAAATLADALAGTTFVLGTTARRRHRVATLGPARAAERLLEEAARGDVAVLFGREDHGLSEDELLAAHAVMAVETAPECRALNLAQAVLLLAYELFRASGRKGVLATSDGGPYVRAEQAAALKEQLARALETLGILHPGSERAVRGTLERLLTLGPMQTRDARVLFMLARRVVERCGVSDGGG